MTNTEAYRHVLNAAIALTKAEMTMPMHARKQLVTAIRKIERRVQRMEARLAHIRSKRRTSTDRPKCLQ
jgi:hypothetical protein